MVHALLECWRILGREGILIDLRPLHADRAIEVLTLASPFVPGHVVDLTGAADDAACAKAIDQVVRSGYFAPQMQDTFEFAVYWDSLAGFSAYAEARWYEKRRLTPEVTERARRYIASTSGPSRIRIRYTMHLAVYRKQEPPPDNRGPHLGRHRICKYE